MNFEKIRRNHDAAWEGLGLACVGVSWRNINERRLGRSQTRTCRLHKQPTWRSLVHNGVNEDSLSYGNPER